MSFTDCFKVLDLKRCRESLIDENVLEHAWAISLIPLICVDPDILEVNTYFIAELWEFGTGEKGVVT